MRVHHQPAYVLLNRPYSETSWVVEIFSRDYGRMALMAKGARRLKSKLKGVLMPFQPVLLSWTGKGEVPTLTAAEIDQSQIDLLAHELSGEALVCAFYCNELVVNLLHRHDPHSKLYNNYHDTIMQLNRERDQDNLATELRRFERSIMKETGYEVSFEYEADGRTRIEESATYRYQASQGFVRVLDPKGRAISGKIIRSMAADNPGQLSHEELSEGKYLMRDILNQTLGQKKIVSRELFFPKTRT